MDTPETAEIEKDVKVDKKIEDILRQCEENIIRMHLDRTGASLDKEEELKDDRILGNFQLIIHALSTSIANEIASINNKDYDEKMKQDVIGYLGKMKLDIDNYERNIAQLRKLVIPPDNLADHNDVASQMRSIMIKRYDKLHDLYRDIISLDAKVINKIEYLNHGH